MANGGIMLGRDVAKRVLAQYGTNDLRTIVQGERLIIKTLHPWGIRADDMYANPCIFIPKGISRAQFRTVVAHCLGHYFQHDGNQVWLRGFDVQWSTKWEHQAEEFAAWLLIPEGEDVAGYSVEGLARRYAIAPELVYVRCGYER